MRGRRKRINPPRRAPEHPCSTAFEALSWIAVPPPSPPPPHLSGAELDLLREAVESNWIAPLGPQVDAFEAELAAATGATDVLALSSGTAALHLALLAHGMGQGDRSPAPI